MQKVTFLRSAEKLADCPEARQPEFAFIGRSNVGKSSLINLLTNRKGLARVSKTPGRTRELNFFSIDDQWILVDLPGYGYAKVSRKQQERFNKFVSDYLLQRSSLFGVFLLVDSRHPPQKIDLEFLGWLIESELSFALVFTKTDKSKAKVVQRNQAQFLEELAKISEGTPVTFLSSAMTGEGKAKILAFIRKAIERGS
ncbi:MAG: ribosome biogenesis GTP-binding protein YihA/YsxC [Akkermansiaceae bacterium]